LGLLGKDVRIVHSGPAALQEIACQRPDVVLLDLGMPGMDGLETAKHIRDRHEWRSIPLIAITGWGQDHDRRRTETAGFSAHLITPVSIAELEAVIARHLASRFPAANSKANNVSAAHASPPRSGDRSEAGGP